MHQEDTGLFYPFFIFLLVISSLPILFSAYLPGVMLPFQVAMAQLIENFSNSNFNEYYTLNFSFKPLMLFFYFANLLKGVIEPLVAVKAFMLLSVLVLPISFYVFLRAVSEDLKWLSLFSFIFVYGETYYFGNLNLLLSFSLFFFGLACLESLLKKIRIPQLLALLFVSALLFYAHFFTFIIYLLALLILQLHNFGAEQRRSFLQLLPLLLVLLLSIILIWPYWGDFIPYLKVFFDRSLTDSVVLMEWMKPWAIFLHLISSPGGALFGFAKMISLIVLILAIVHPLFRKQILFNLGNIVNGKEYSNQAKYIYVLMLLLVILFLMPGAISFIENASLGIENNTFFKLNYQLIPLISLFLITILPAKLYHANFSKYIISFTVLVVLGLTFIFHIQFQKEVKSFNNLIDLMDAKRNVLVISSNPVSKYFSKDFPILNYLPAYYVYEKQGIVSEFPDQGRYPVRFIKDKRRPIILFDEDKKISQKVLDYYDYYLFRFAGDAYVQDIAVTKTTKFLADYNIDKISDIDMWHLYAE